MSMFQTPQDNQNKQVSFDMTDPMNDDDQRVHIKYPVSPTKTIRREQSREDMMHVVEALADTPKSTDSGLLSETEELLSHVPNVPSTVRRLQALRDTPSPPLVRSLEQSFDQAAIDEPIPTQTYHGISNDMANMSIDNDRIHDEMSISDNAELEFESAIATTGLFIPTPEQERTIRHKVSDVTDDMELHEEHKVSPNTKTMNRSIQSTPVIVRRRYSQEIIDLSPSIPKTTKLEFLLPEFDEEKGEEGVFY